jgi:hypothetical protein
VASEHQDDNYFDNAASRFGKNKYAAEFASKHQAADQRYFGLLLGKYMNHWWD